MNTFINIAALFALCFWPLALFSSAMMFAAPGSSDNQHNIQFVILVLCYPIYIFTLMSLFNHPFFFIKPPYHLILSTIIVVSGLNMFGYLRMYKNTFYGISNSEITITNNAVYVAGRKAENADPKTFTVIKEFGSGLYFKDKDQVYYRDRVIRGADVDTFEMLEHPEWGKTGHSFTKDKNRVYYFSKVIEGANVETFEVIDNIQAKDKNHKYYDGVRVKP